MAETRIRLLLRLLLFLIIHIYQGRSLSINMNDAYHKSHNIFTTNLKSRSSPTTQSEKINSTSIQNFNSSNINEIKSNGTGAGNLKYKTLQEALNGLQKFEYESEEESWICTTCKQITGVMSTYIYFGGSFKGTVERTLRNICTMVVDYDPDTFCTGLISQEENQLELEWIYRNRYVYPEDSCSQLLGNRGCRDFRGGEWMIELPPVKNKNDSISSHNVNSTNGNKHLSNENMSYHKINVENNINETLADSSIRDTDLAKAAQDNIEADLSRNRREAEDRNTNKDLKDSSNSSQLVGKRVLKVLHLTDPHYDPHYKVGSNARCNNPLCCHSDSGVLMSPSDAAGKWGDYRHCDSPKWLLENMYQHIIDNHPDIDYIMNTGDLVPHHVWKVSRQDNLDVINEASDMMLHYFPNIPIYSTIGNHESFPVNSFPPPETDAWATFNVQWLYDALSDQWSKLMHQEVPSTARYAGYYSILVKPGLRIISINTNYCYRFNWWLLYKSEDPGNVLKWMTKELESAEAADEKVHIIGHIPPLLSDCFQQWGHQFSRIVSRFSNTIRGQFYGHTHYDEFRLHYDTEAEDIPVGIEYITPNNGPFKYVNPTYRIFYVDGEHENSSRDVLDYETWVMNLTHANLHDDPHWYHLYSARQDLNMENLSPQSWNKLVHNMAENKQLFDKYFRYRIQDSDVELELGCNEYCQREILCNMVDGNKLIPTKCQ